MTITTNPLNSNTRTSTPAAKLVEASGLQLPSQAASEPVPLPTEKVSLRSSTQELSDAALAEISSLKARDIKVHQHEQAHLAASAGLNVSKAAFTYQRGPDGVNYAVGGDVRIDTSSGRTPADSLARADMIIDVALAPADPTPSDRSAAAKAQQMAQQARVELVQQANVVVSKHADHYVNINTHPDKEAPVHQHIDTYA
jgi:hypothetical protein